MSDKIEQDVARLLANFIEVHRGWCNYCQGRVDVCERSKGTTWECSLIQGREAVTAYVRGLAAEITERNKIITSKIAGMDQLRDELAILRQRLEDVDLKDRGKTNEINILTKENNTLRRENEQLKAERDALRQRLAEAERERNAWNTSVYNILVGFTGKYGPLAIPVKGMDPSWCKPLKEEITKLLAERDAAHVAGMKAIQELYAGMWSLPHWEIAVSIADAIKAREGK